MKKNKFLTSILNSLKKKKNSTPSLVVAFLVIIILIGGLYYFRGQFISATINGQPIWRLSLIRELEQQAGKDTLESLITKTLILQEAKKQKITATKEEIDQKMKELEENFTSQGQNLDQLLEAQGLTRDQLREQVEIQLIIEKIVGEEVEVTDQELDEYIEANQDFFPEDSDPEETRASVREQLKQEKTNEKIQSWLESLRNDAKINYF
jgi:foldase protein PrsA